MLINEVIKKMFKRSKSVFKIINYGKLRRQYDTNQENVLNCFLFFIKQ